MRPTAKASKHSERICRHKVKKYDAILKRVKKLQSTLMRQIENTPCRKRKYSSSCTSLSSLSTSSHSSSMPCTSLSDKENRLDTRPALRTNSNESLEVMVKHQKDEPLMDKTGNARFTKSKRRNITSTPLHNENVKGNVIKNRPEKTSTMNKEKLVRNTERQGCSKMAGKRLIGAKKNDLTSAKNTGNKISAEKEETRCDKNMIISKKSNEIEKNKEEPLIKKIKSVITEARDGEISDKIEKQSKINTEIFRDRDTSKNRTGDFPDHVTPIPKKPVEAAESEKFVKKLDRSIGQIFADNWTSIAKRGLSQDDDDAGKILATLRHDHFQLRLSYILPWMDIFTSDEIGNDNFFPRHIFGEEFMGNYWKDASTNKHSIDDESRTNSIDDDNAPMTLDPENSQILMDRENNSTMIDEVNPSISINRANASTSFHREENSSLNRPRNASSSSDSSCAERDDNSSSSDQECERRLTMLNYLRRWFSGKTETVPQKPKILEVNILTPANDEAPLQRSSKRENIIDEPRPSVGKAQLSGKLRSDDRSKIRSKLTPGKKNNSEKLIISMKKNERVKNSLELLEKSGECFCDGKTAKKFDSRDKESNRSNSFDEILNDGNGEDFESILDHSDSQKDALSFYSWVNSTMGKNRDIEVENIEHENSKKEDIKKRRVDVGDEDDKNIKISSEDGEKRGKLPVALKTRGEKIPTLYGDYDDASMSEHEEEKQSRSTFEETEMRKNNSTTKISEFPGIAKTRLPTKIVRLQPRKTASGKSFFAMEISQKISDKDKH